MKEFEFKCGSCDEVHKGIPTFGFKQPLAAFMIAENEKAKLDLDVDDCVINGERFFL